MISIDEGNKIVVDGSVEEIIRENGAVPATIAILDGVLKILGNGFTSAIKMMVVPLVFVSLICGTASMGDVKKYCESIRGIFTQEKRDEIESIFDYLGKAFREITGMTVIAYIQKVRLSEACRLLSETDKTVSEIGNHCTFTNTSHFIRLFKQRFNITPYALKRQIQKQK